MFLNYAFCLVFYHIPTNIFVYILGSFQRGWLQHECVYERTILTVYFVIYDLYASTSIRSTQKGSTKRSPSFWEHVDSRDPETHASYTKSTGSSRKRARKSNISHSPPKSLLVKVNIPHKDQILSIMHEYIEKLVDVVGDGYCGFRTVVGLRVVDDYQMICYQLQKELTGEESECYPRLTRTNHWFNQVLHALSGDGIRCDPLDKRMIMSDMGFLISQRYKHVVFLLSIKKVRSETFSSMQCTIA